MLLEDMAKKFLNSVLIFNTLDTYSFYEEHVRNVLEYFKECQVVTDDQLTYDNVCNFILYQKKNNLSNNTINKRILCLKRVLKYNCSASYNFFDRVKKLSEKKVSFDYLRKNELMRLVEYIDNSRLSVKNRSILSVFLDTGIRLNELINITINNVNLSDRMILLTQTKTNKNRIVFFTDRTQELLTEYLKTKTGIYLFEVTKSGVRSMFARTQKVLGFSKFHPHMLRHTYATLLVKSNTNLEFIRMTMGHSNLNTTKRYLHCDLDDLKLTYEKQFKLS